MSFTRRGWTLLGATVGMILAARLLGLPQLLVIGTTLLGLLVICAVWTVTRSDALVRVARALPERIHVGGDGRVDLTVVNEGGQTSATIAFTDDFDGGERSARFLLAPLEPQATAARRTACPPTRAAATSSGHSSPRSAIRSASPGAAGRPRAGARSSCTHACTRSCRYRSLAVRASTPTRVTCSAGPTPRASSTPCASTARATTCGACTGRPRPGAVA